MSLRFLIGRAGTGKSRQCLAEIADELLRVPLGRPLILLVPEQASFEYEQQLAAWQGLGGAMGAQVLSFGRLFQKFCGDLPCSKRPRIDDVGKTMLLSRLLVKRGSELQLFRATGRQSGFCESLVRLTNELQSFAISPADLAQAAEKLAGKSSTSAKLHDIGLLYSDLLAALGEEYLDESIALTHLAQQIAASDFLREAEIWVDGFSYFNTRQLAVLEQLLLHTARVNVALPLDCSLIGRQKVPKDHLFFNIWQTYRSLQQAAAKCGVAEELPCLLTENFRQAASPDLLALEQGLAQGRRQVSAAAPCAIELICADSRAQEAAFAAQTILQLCREQGLRYRDFALVVRNIDDYREVLEQVLSEYEVPHFLDTSYNLRTHALVEALLAALEVAADDFWQLAVFRFLKSGFSELAADDICRLENYCLAYGVRGGDWHAHKPWQHLLDRDEMLVEEQMEIDELRRQAAAPLLTFAAAVGRGSSAINFCRAINLLLDNLQAEQRLSELAAAAVQKGKLSESKIHLQIYGNLQQLLAQISDFMGEEKMDCAQMQQLLLRGLAALELEIVPPCLDEVLVADLQRSRTPNVKVCFVLGVNDGVLPARLVDDGILGVVERQELSALGLALSPDQRQKQLEEQYLGYVALTRAAQHLYICYALRDSSGAACLPSMLVEQVKEIFPALVEQKPQFDSLLPAGKALFHRLTGILSAGLAGEAVSAPWWQAYQLLAEDAACAQTVANLVAALAYRPEVAPLPLELSQQLYGKISSVSISRLESYNRCPCLYFGRYGLHLEPRKEWQLKPVDIGSIYHQVLEQVVRQISDWHNLEKAQIDAYVEQAMAQIRLGGLAAVFAARGKHTYMEEKIKAVVSQAIFVTAQQLALGDFTPVGLETKFGANQPLRGVTLQLADGGTVELQGQIDRIDCGKNEASDYYRIIDYKSGQRDLAAADIFSGVSWQLPLYLQTVLQNRPAAKPAGMFYVIIRELLRSGENREQALAARNPQLKLNGLPILDLDALKIAEKDWQSGWAQTMSVALGKEGFYKNSRGLSPGQYEIVQAYIQQQAGRTVSAIAAGEVQPQPWQSGKKIACDTCDYTALCALDRALLPECAAVDWGGYNTEQSLYRMALACYGDGGAAEQAGKLTDEKSQNKGGEGDE